MVLSEATHINIKLIIGKSTNLTSPCCLVDRAGVLTLAVDETAAESRGRFSVCISFKRPYKSARDIPRYY